jgi:hypothetical protein
MGYVSARQCDGHLHRDGLPLPAAHKSGQEIRRDPLHLYTSVFGGI